MKQGIKNLYLPLLLLALFTACASQTPTPLSAEALAELPTFSQGKGRLAFAAMQQASDQYELYTLNLEDGTQLQLTDNDVADIAPCWSVDGSEIMYASAVDEVYNLFRLKTDGSEPTRLFTYSADCTEPAWEPLLSGGDTIAYQSDGNGDFDIYLLDLPTNSFSVITTTDSQETQAAWSPDGSHIAYVSNADGDFEIFVMEADGKNPQQLTSNEAYDSNPVWSPDGKQIAFISRRDDSSYFQLFIMDADGSAESQLTSEGFTSHTPTWSPDGKYLAFIGDTPAGSRILVLDMATHQLAQIASGFYDYAGLSWSE